MKKILLIICSVFVLFDKLSSIDGTINFLNRIGMNTQMLINFFIILNNTLNFITPFIVIWLVYFVLELKEKVKALKQFRDLEAIRTANHYNAQIKTFQDAFDDIQKVCNVWKEGKPTKSPSDEKNEAEDRKHQIKEILEYNNSFKDWGIGDYAINPLLETFYKTKDYGK